MKILSIVYEYPPIGGGGGVVASSLNEALVHFGDEIEVVTSAMPGLDRDAEINGVKVHRVPCWRRHRHYTTALELATTLWPSYRRAAEVVRRLEPELIHTHFVIPSGLVAMLIGLQFNIPVVITAHGSDIPGYNPDRFRRMHWFVHPLWRWIIRRAARVTSPSNYLAGLIGSHIDMPVTVIPNGYAPARRQGREKRKLVLVVARLFPRKGVQHFIDAIAPLGEDWEFVIAGDGPFRKALERRARRLRAKVRFAGYLDPVTLRGLYEEAGILVFPSTRENFPVVLLEAMDAGCAIITSDDAGSVEVVGDAGLTVPKGDVQAIRGALERLMRDPDACQRFGARARERSREFRWPMIAHRFRSLFADVLGCEPPDTSHLGDLGATGIFSGVVAPGPGRRRQL